MSELSKDVVLAIVLMVFGAGALIVLAYTHSGGAHVANVVGFATLPRLYASLLIGLGALLGGNSLIEMHRDARAGRAPLRNRSPLADRTVLLRTVGTVALLVLYVIGLEHTAFFPATTVFLGVMFLIYGRAPLWRVLLVAILGAAALDVLFIQVINLPLH